MVSQRQRQFLLTALFILTIVRPCLAAVRSHDQFQTFLSSFDGPYHKDFLPNCTREFNDYINETLPDPPNAGHNIAWLLTNCILSQMPEVFKAEIAVSGILLALVPTALAQIGPSQVETGLLSLRRPFLALLLEVGTPSPNPSRGNIYATPLKALSSPLEAQWPSFLNRAPFVLKAALSVFEYAVAMTATGNCVYQIYRLTYRAVSLAPIVVLLRNVPETAVLFGWLLLLVPIHAFSVATFLSLYRVPTPRRSLYLWLVDEVTPCCYGRPVRLVARSKNPWQGLLFFITTFGVCVHIMMGTVLLGSVMFVTLADVIPVVESFVGCALASRVLLIFELHGMRMASAMATELRSNSNIEQDFPAQSSQSSRLNEQGPLLNSNSKISGAEEVFERFDTVQARTL